MLKKGMYFVLSALCLSFLVSGLFDQSAHARDNRRRDMGFPMGRGMQRGRDIDIRQLPKELAEDPELKQYINVQEFVKKQIRVLNEKIEDIEEEALDTDKVKAALAKAMQASIDFSKASESDAEYAELLKQSSESRQEAEDMMKNMPKDMGREERRDLFRESFELRRKEQELKEKAAVHVTSSPALSEKWKAFVAATTEFEKIYNEALATKPEYAKMMKDREELQKRNELYSQIINAKVKEKMDALRGQEKPDNKGGKDDKKKKVF